MRFLFIIDSLETGGAERMVISLTEKLIEFGHNVTLLVLKNSISLDVPAGTSLHILGYRKISYAPYNLIYAVRLRLLIKKLSAEAGGFDVITSNLNLSNRLTHISRLKNIYYCIHEAVSISSLSKREGLSKKMRAWRIRSILNGKSIITVSRGIQEDLLNRVGVRPRDIRTIYNAVSFSRVISLMEQGVCEFEGEYMVHVGRLSEEKRHDILLKAFITSGVKCRLVIVGDGPERSRIEDMVEKYGLEKRVLMTGNLKNPYPVMSDALLTLLTSDYEGLPTVLVESFVVSTPVVSVDCDYGPREILGKKFDHYLAKVGDAEDVAKKIILAMHDLSEGRLAVNQSDVKKFDINSVAKQYVALRS